MKLFVRLVMVMVMGLTLASCGAMQKAPAQAALATAQTAFDAVKENAAKVLPDETQKVQDSFDAAKASFDKGDYKGALDAAKGLPDQVKSLSDAVAAKATELKATWDSMSASIPAAMATLTGAVAKMKHAPAGMDAAAFDGLKSNLASASQSWTDAQAAAQNGDVATAVTKADEVQKIATDAMAALKMKAPDTK